ncbi:MAG: hypothetical protein ACI4RN_05865 [Oscillospiraceae bacterium]
MNSRMNDNKKSNPENDAKKVIPNEDYEYEKEMAEQARKQKLLAQQAEKARREKEIQEQKNREKRLQQERIELLKLKNGVIDDSEEFQEHHDPKIELHGTAKLANIWYHFKWIILFVAFLILVAGYITYDTLSRTKPDLQILMVANNGLQYREEELENFFEKYMTDINDDGEVKAEVIIAPLDKNKLDEMHTTYQNKVAGALQSGDALMLICDSNTDETVQEIFKNVKSEFPDNKYITDKGLSLNMQLFAKEIDFESLPNDVYLAIRQPAKTMNCSLEEMNEKYDINFKVFSKIANDLNKQATETNDPGLTTEPIKYDSQADSKTDSSDTTVSSHNETSGE